MRFSSFAQERMWPLERMLPYVTAYNVPRLLRVPGRFDPDGPAVAHSTPSLRGTRRSRTGYFALGRRHARAAGLTTIESIQLEVHDLRDTQ